jgi:hypothetical protein
VLFRGCAQVSAVVGNCKDSVLEYILIMTNVYTLYSCRRLAAVQLLPLFFDPTFLFCFVLPPMIQDLCDVLEKGRTKKSHIV